MKIGIISDTHDNIPKIEKAVTILKKDNVEFIFHGGDIISPFSAKKFATFGKKFISVFGNNDGEKWLLSEVIRKFGGIIEEGPLKFNIENKKILLLHGYKDIEMTLEIVNGLAKKGDFDLILYGHTHKKDIRKIDETVIINPGEACGYLTGSSTLVILDLETLDSKIIEF